MPHAVRNTDTVDARPIEARPMRVGPADHEVEVDHEVEEWNHKLKGKKLGETTDETVRLAPSRCHGAANRLQTFAMSDLPPVRRIIKHGYAITLELIGNRSV